MSCRRSGETGSIFLNGTFSTDSGANAEVLKLKVGVGSHEKLHHWV